MNVMQESAGRRIAQRGRVAGVVVMLMFASANAAAAQLPLPINPLFVSNDVAPNIMFMVDNSGSMTNLVPEAPYDPKVVYLATCNGTALIAAGTSVDLNVRTSGTSTGSPPQQGPRIVLGSGRYRLGNTPASQRCFATNSIYGARLFADNAATLTATDTATGNTNQTFLQPSGYLDADYTGNYLNWYFNATNTVAWTNQPRKPLTATTFVASRIEIARKAGVDLIGGLDARLRIGLSTYNGADGGALREVIAPLDTTKKTAVINSINALTASGSTPLAETLLDIGRYFANGYTGNLTLNPDVPARRTTATVAQVFNSTFANNSNVAPITLSCQQSFAALLTDGRPQEDRTVSTFLESYIGDCPGCSFDQKPPPYAYESAGSGYFDNVTKALFDIDFRPDFPVENDGKQFKNNVVSYVIGFADEQAKSDPQLIDAGREGGGGFFVAENAAALATTFNSIISDILERAASFSSAALNSTSLSNGTRLFQAGFNSANWTGTLTAFPISTGSNCGSVALGRLCGESWNASTVLNSTTPDTRRIITINTATRVGIPFRWASLPAAQQALLNRNPNVLPTESADTKGQDRLNYLRGDRNMEGTNQFRARGGRLGDIVDSDPAFVGAPSAALPFSGYSSFRNNNANRTPMVYVGANDGMLHGFRASDGAELIAYVPGAMYGTNANPKLARLTALPYTHIFGVDGSPGVGDVQIGSSLSWATYLVGSLRYGGRGVYALDVTNPGNFAESNAASLFKWEFTAADDADLGYTFSQPILVKMRNGRWAAVLGNGYNNREAGAAGSGRAALFVLYLDGPGADGVWNQGTDYVKLLVGPTPTTGETDNGLATPAVVDVDGDSVADYIYAGDLLGNLWQFNFNCDPSKTGCTWQAGYGGSPLFKALSNAGVAQPITAPPEVGFNLLTSTDTDDLVIYFGTGRYIATGDNTPLNQQNQTFYGIFADPIEAATPFKERTASPNAAKTDLLRQKVLSQGSINGNGVRVTTKEVFTRATDGSIAKKGWYIDLYNTGTAGTDPTPASGLNKGERQISRPLLRAGRIVFTTLLPSEQPCEFGGSGWLMEIDAATGGRPSKPALDITNNLIVDSLDVFNTTIDGKPVAVPVSGMQSATGMLSSPAVLALNPAEGGDREAKYSVRSDGTTAVFGEAGSSRSGRITWREISP